MQDEVCLITGVGPGTGSALARRFSETYRVAMVARSAERLAELEQELPGAKAFPCDVTDKGALEDTVASIREVMGKPSLLVHNAVGGAFGDVLKIDPERFELNFQINAMSLLHLIQALGPDMVEAGHGAILATGNTSAYRGRSNFAGFAPTKAAQRILLESAARHLGPKGVHVSYVAIDAVIDLSWTRQAFPDRPDEFFCKPKDIAQECYRIAHQARSAWSFDVVIRPYGENW
ncbi:MAG: SDR family NAD(P)-dependent oxidoreductase [Candidatus Binatia bacterium]|nr:SDR family NAD(P)-dependent oxidoreductase [Candidatus Binatia bacterium]